MNNKYHVQSLGKTTQSQTILYGIALTVSDKSVKQKEIWKSIKDYKILQRQIIEFAFDFDPIFTNKTGMKSDDDIFKAISSFYDIISERPDIRDHSIVRTFLNYPQDDFQCLDQWTSFRVSNQESSVIDMAWDLNSMDIFVAQEPKNKIKKITSFFKEILSSGKNDGLITLHRQTKGQWKVVWKLIPQAQIKKIKWSRQTGLLHVCTEIGIFIYSILIMKDLPTHELLGFIQIYGFRDMVYGSKLGATFYCTNQKMHVHSISKQLHFELNPQPIKQICAMALQKSENRLYTSNQGHLRIYDVSDFKQMKMVALIQIFSNGAHFQKLALSPNDKYLFGLNSLGYISVFEIKPPGKQKLTNILTNIDCPKDSEILSFNQNKQYLVVSHNKYIVLISTKNYPLYSGGNIKQRITSGGFDNKNNFIITGDAGGWVSIYNVSLNVSKQELVE